MRVAISSVVTTRPPTTSAVARHGPSTADNIWSRTTVFVLGSARKLTDNTPTNKICRRAPWAAHKKIDHTRDCLVEDCFRSFLSARHDTRSIFGIVLDCGKCRYDWSLVLQCVTVRHSELQWVAVNCSELQWIADCMNHMLPGIPFFLSCFTHPKRKQTIHTWKHTKFYK